MGDWVVVLLLAVFWGALGLIAAIVGREVWWQVRAAVAGIREWHAQRATPRPNPHTAGTPMYPPGSPLYDPDEEFCEDCQTICTDYRPCMCCHVDNLERESDDEWAEELHRINGLGKMGDLTRPIHDLTHYEVEAVIRQLRVPDWLPAYRLAA